MLLVASAGLQGKAEAAPQTIFGTNFASLVLIVLSVLILKGALNINEQWLNGIKVLGCLYIAYIGFDILKEVASRSSAENEMTLNAVSGGFKKGFLVGISVLSSSRNIKLKRLLILETNLLNGARLLGDFEFRPTIAVEFY